MKKAKKDMSIILPIWPVYVNRIKFGMKKVEFRKRLWNERNEVKRVFIYETRPKSAIVGYFEIADILFGTPTEVYKMAGMFTGIDYSDYKKYAGDSDSMKGILIRYPVFFKRPVSIFELGFKHPPQSFYLIDAETGDKLISNSTLDLDDPGIISNWFSSKEISFLKYIESHCGSVDRRSVH
ncbi:MAG: hypothetical protein LBU81_04715 [Methanosarcinales archaeon]|jgi:predicted transcriptional regulator|nr:hypothetical protein [Methanosarcinales archaeon]